MSFFYRSFSMVSRSNMYHIVKNYTDKGNMDKKLKEYLTAVNENMTHAIAYNCSGEELDAIIYVLKSEYSQYKNSVMWKTGIYLGNFIDIRLGEKIFRVTFKKKANGHYDTLVKFLSRRNDIPAFFQCCNYCRVGLSSKRAKTCSRCSTIYCCRNCQAMDWISYHSYHCP